MTGVGRAPGSSQVHRSVLLLPSNLVLGKLLNLAAFS